MTTTPALNDDLAKDRADWLLDAVACATQDRRFLRGEPEYDDVAGDAILMNGEKAIRVALEAQSKEIEALRSALEPSAETKAAYSGEFYERVEISNPNFDEDDENEPETLVQQVPVSWTTIKEIMAAIRARTALKGA